MIIIEHRPTRPDEERGWPVRHLASIMGRAGCSVMTVQNGIVLVGVAILGSVIAATLGGGASPDLSGAAGVILLAEILDLIGLGLIATALVSLGVGAILLHRRDPVTEEEVRIPTLTAILPIVAGLFVFAWVVLTAVWRLWYPSGIGRTAAEMLAEFAATGAILAAPGLVTSMMLLWIVACAALLFGSAQLRLFVRRLPTKIVPPRPLRRSVWIWFALVNLGLTALVAAFPLGWLPFRGFEGVYFSALGAKITVVPIFGILAYLTLLTWFEAFDRLSILVPILRAVPQEEARKEYGTGAQTLGRPGQQVQDNEMAGIGHIK